MQEIDELRECLRIAMREWEFWVGDARGRKPEGEGWDRCLAALGKSQNAEELQVFAKQLFSEFGKRLALAIEADFVGEVKRDA